MVGPKITNKVKENLSKDYSNKIMLQQAIKYLVNALKTYRLTSTASVPLSIRSIFVSTPKVLSPESTTMHFYKTGT